MTATSALPPAAFAQPISFKMRAKFGTSFSNHNMTVPQMLVFKLSNEIELETDLTFARQ